MSFEVGKIKIINYIDDLNFFKFKKNNIEYYAIKFVFEKLSEGYLIFSLSPKLDKLFQQSDYNSNIIKELINNQTNNIYIISFAEEDPETEMIEYVSKVDAGIAIEIYNNK